MGLALEWVDYRKVAGPKIRRLGKKGARVVRIIGFLKEQHLEEFDSMGGDLNLFMKTWRARFSKNGSGGERPSSGWARFRLVYVWVSSRRVHLIGLKAFACDNSDRWGEFCLARMSRFSDDTGDAEDWRDGAEAVLTAGRDSGWLEFARVLDPVPAHVVERLRRARLRRKVFEGL